MKSPRLTSKSLSMSQYCSSQNFSSQEQHNSSSQQQNIVKGFGKHYKAFHHTELDVDDLKDNLQQAITKFLQGEEDKKNFDKMNFIEQVYFLYDILLPDTQTTKRSGIKKRIAKLLRLANHSTISKILLQRNEQIGQQGAPSLLNKNDYDNIVQYITSNQKRRKYLSDADIHHWFIKNYRVVNEITFFRHLNQIPGLGRRKAQPLDRKRYLLSKDDILEMISVLKAELDSTLACFVINIDETEANDRSTNDTTQMYIRVNENEEKRIVDEANSNNIEKTLYAQDDIDDNIYRNVKVFCKNRKYESVLINNSKTLYYYPTDCNTQRVSVIGGITVSGCSFPPMVVSAYSSIDKEILTKYGWSNVVFYQQENGYFTQHSFLRYLNDVVLSYIIEKRKMYGSFHQAKIILDGYHGHFSREIDEFCMKHNIVMLVLPPHSSHVTQPMDLCIFGLMKRNIEKSINWEDSASRADALNNVLSSYYIAVKPPNVIASFNRIGVYSICKDNAAILHTVYMPSIHCPYIKNFDIEINEKEMWSISKKPNKNSTIPIDRTWLYEINEYQQISAQSDGSSQLKGHESEMVVETSNTNENENDQSTTVENKNTVPNNENPEDKEELRKRYKIVKKMHREKLLTTKKMLINELVNLDSSLTHEALKKWKKRALVDRFNGLKDQRN